MLSSLFRQTIVFWFKYIEMIFLMYYAFAVNVFWTQGVGLSIQWKMCEQYGSRINAVTQLFFSIQRKIDQFELSLSFITKLAPIVFHRHAIDNNKIQIISFFGLIKIHKLLTIKRFVKALNFLFFYYINENEPGMVSYFSNQNSFKNNLSYHNEIRRHDFQL